MSPKSCRLTTYDTFGRYQSRLHHIKIRIIAAEGFGSAEVRSGIILPLTLMRLYAHGSESRA